MEIKKYGRFLEKINEQFGHDDDDDDENPFDDEPRERRIKEKEPRKDFKVGDSVKCINKEQKKLPDDAYQFLLTYNSFIVKDVNENKSIYLGFDRNGEHYMFAPNRFEIIEAAKPKEVIVPGEKKKNWWD